MIEDVAADPGEWALEVKDLCLAHGNHRVLEAMNFRILAGEFCFLLGANGSGKTTLLHALLGDEGIRRGEIFRNPEIATPRHTGFVPQKCVMDRSLPTTVREFMDLGLLGLALDRAARRMRIREGLEQVGYSELEHRPFWSLSEGMRQRVLLGRALARRPRLLYLDEPTASLDATATKKFWELLRQLHHDQELTILCISHDPWAASRLATSHLTLEGGQLEATMPRDLMAELGD